MKEKNIAKKWLTAKELGVMLSISTPLVLKLARDGMPCVNVGANPKFSRSWSPRFSPDECLEWLKSKDSRKEAAQ